MTIIEAQKSAAKQSIISENGQIIILAISIDENGHLGGNQTPPNISTSALVWMRANW